jgi:hypothetical protein
VTYLSYIQPLLACYMTCNFVSLTPSLVLFLCQFYAPTFYNLYNSSSVGEAVHARAPVDRNHLFKDPLVSIPYRPLPLSEFPLEPFFTRKKRPLHQLKGPTSPRIVTSKEHSKHTGMRPTVLSLHSFINYPFSPYRPLPLSEFPLEPFFTRVYKKT